MGYQCGSNRNSCLNEMLSLRTLADRVKTDKTVHTLFKVRYAEMETLREDFLKQHQSVLALLLPEQEVDLEIEERLREGFLNDFFAVKTVFVELFENENTIRLSQNFDNNLTRPQPISHARLPKLEIPKFNGDFKAFVTFMDPFDALVHHNAALSSVEKYNYLISTLEGQPLSLVRTLPMTGENYQIAYDALVERYSNKRIRAQTHWSAIESTTKISANNSVALRKLLDIFSENLAALKTLNFPVDEWDFVMMMMLLKRLDNATITRFELEHGSSEVPTYKSLVEFLNKQCIAYATLNICSSNEFIKSTNNVVKSRSYHVVNRTASFFVNKPNSSECPLCKENHTLYNCSSVLSKTPMERYNFCKSSRLCLNCLSNIHDLRNCKSVSTCRPCHRRHHSLLHFEKAVVANERSSASDNTNYVSQPSTSRVNPAMAGMLAKTSFVLLSTALIEIKDLSSNYQVLRCLLDPGSMTSFITQKAVHRLGLPKDKFAIEVKGLSDMQTYVSDGRVTISFRPIGQPSPILITDAIILNKICDNLPSSPITIQSWSHISNLKLADPKFNSPGAIDILLGADVFSKLILNDREPDALNTIFGYVLMGKLGHNTPTVSSFFCNRMETSLNTTLKKIWEVEAVPTLAVASPDDELCERLFLDTHTRDPCGTRDLALQRFYSLECRLVKQPALYLQYCEFMREYLDLGHMDLISSDNGVEGSSAHIYYIPHHCVLKPDSRTTKLRVLAKEEEQNSPLAANAVKFDTYVDDIVTGSSSYKNAQILQKQLVTLMKKGGFELRKWSSNDHTLLSDLPDSHLSNHPLAFNCEVESALIKILGLQWNPVHDCFSFSVCPLDRTCTKRNLLSELARVFDLVGFIAPVTFFTKHLIQQLWVLGIEWDDQPCNEFIPWIKSSPHRWKTFVANRVAFIQGKIPPTSWFYIESRNNPADIGSRGCLPSNLLSHSLWFAGPSFLLDRESLKFTPLHLEPTEVFSDEERKIVLLTNNLHNENIIDTLLNKFFFVFDTSTHSGILS
ncbi:hypothetical protein NQ317_005509 [Molorchus minor]|uniref:Peptidase aspartic putative domain-containing protein n=1 Tax=Molorchus minor TaxID=1323400 RepID=A0ABQ9IT95_9CUCU|nr:hypothetical protein NQ317_005509 [Molorchus minor]